MIFEINARLIIYFGNFVLDFFITLVLKGHLNFIQIYSLSIIIKNMIYVMKKKNYEISSCGEITSKKSSSFLRGPRVPIMLIKLRL